jgi:nicotinate-nucleotide adenylyltransferase
MRRIFFGGTFDPIHVGHTRLAMECQRQLAAPFIFVPNGAPPHKDFPQVAVAQRLAMVELAVEELNRACVQPSFAVDRLEIDLAAPSYTIVTLSTLRQRYPDDDLFWLIGMDSLVHLESWHRWQELTEFANLLVVNRPGWQLPQSGLVANWLAPKFAELDDAKQLGKVILLSTTPLDIASSTLKPLLQQSDRGKFLLPESVRDYIVAHRLYPSVN